MLTTIQKQTVDFVEQHFYLEGRIPAAVVVARELNLPQDAIQEALTNPEVLAIFDDLGLPIKQNIGGLTAMQITVANTLLNPSDRRSETKKLADLGVSANKYQAWRRDSKFLGYMHSRAEAIFGDSMDEVILSTVDSAKRGDVSAQKLYFGMTGRYNEKSNDAINVTDLALKFIEACQKHIKDPEIITRIASEIGMSQRAVGSNVIQGELEGFNI